MESELTDRDLDPSTLFSGVKMDQTHSLVTDAQEFHSCPPLDTHTTRVKIQYRPHNESLIHDHCKSQHLRST